MSYFLQNFSFLSQEPGIFKSADVLRDGGNGFIVGARCRFLIVLKSMFMNAIRHCVCILGA